MLSLSSYSLEIKAPRLLFVFVHVGTGHAHFQSDDVCISYEPERPTLVYFSCRVPENQLGKP